MMTSSNWTFSALLALCAGNSPVTGEFPHRGQWRRALMFSLIYAWTNGWVNNRDAGGLRRHRPNYGVIVMIQASAYPFATKSLPDPMMKCWNKIYSNSNQNWNIFLTKMHPKWHLQDGGHLSGGTKPLSGSVLNNYQWGVVALIGRQFHRECSRYISLILLGKLLI